VDLGWADVVAALIKAGVGVEGAATGGGTGVLQKAIVRHQPEIVRILLEAGANPNIPGPPYRAGDYGSYWAPLWMALVRETPPDLSLAALLIAHGANVNVVDSEGRSILQTAIAQNRPGVVELLVKSGAKRTSPPK
jgi:ankyrin repeat protein